MQNSNCYTFEKRQYNNGFLDSFVDATYILTMENSKRKDDYENQLKEYIPTKTIYIIHNKGYKKCNKKLFKQTPNYDLLDAYLNAMNHSIKNNYNNILILEDDFIFNKKIKDNKIINDIKYLFDNNVNKSFYFNLGPFPVLFYPSINSNIYRGIYSTLTHGVIYNKNIIFKIINDSNMNDYHQIDEYLTANYKNYFYKIPLSYQTFPETDNKKYWGGDNAGSIYNIYLIKIINFLHDILETNINPKLGFNRIYNILFFINYFLYIIIILFIVFITYSIINFLKNKNVRKIKFGKK
jgi:hypothetical protein